MSSRMSSTARHDKLRTLQKREAAKTRMGRLQMILQQKLIQKYGTTKNTSSRLNTEIREEVKAFTSRATGPLSDEEFLELENSVRELRAKYGRISSAPIREDRRESTTISERSGGGSGQNSTTGRLASTGGAGDDNGNDEEERLPPSIARAWRTFDVAKQIELEAKEKEKENKAKQEKIRFQKELDIYRSEKERQKAEEEMERRKQVEETEKNLTAFRLEQDTIKKREAERHAEDAFLRQKQIMSHQEEKEKRKKAQLDRERQEIEQCKLQLQAEKNEMERKRMEEKKRFALIKEESVRQKEIRAQKQREMNELDAKMIRDHVHMLDEEERKRAKDIRDRMKRYEEIGDFWKNRGAGKRDAEIEAREEQQTLEAARRKEEADLERERQAAEKRRLAMIAMATENQKVIAEKNAMKAKLRQESLEFAQRFLNDSEAFLKEEKDKLAKKRDTTARYRRDLAKQVEEAKARRIEDEMNDTEFMLNRDIVKKLEADKKLVAQIKRRMENAP